MTQNTFDTDYAYALLMEGQLDAMYLPSGAVVWLWQHNRPEAQLNAAVTAAVAAKRAGNPVDDAALLRSDQNVLVLHLQSGDTINIYPDGGYGSRGQVIDGIDAFVQGTVYDTEPALDMSVEPEPTVALPDDIIT